MKKIDGIPKTIRKLFTGVKYTIYYYQREYQWQTKQIEELIDSGNKYGGLREKNHENKNPNFSSSIIFSVDINAMQNRLCRN